MSIGNNIALELKKRNLSEHDLAQRAGLSVIDLKRAEDGFLALSAKELKKIADEIDVSLSALTDERDPEEYRCLLHCMGTYEKQESKNKIIDFIDKYVYIENERLAES